MSTFCLLVIFGPLDPNWANFHVSVTPKTGASGSPVYQGHDRDPLMCFSGRGRKELRFEGCWSNVGPTVPEIWAISWDNISNLSLGPISHALCKTGASGFPVLPRHVRDRLRCSADSRRKKLRFEGCWSNVGLTVHEIEAISRGDLFNSNLGEIVT